jgi:hypothetical protein
LPKYDAFDKDATLKIFYKIFCVTPPLPAEFGIFRYNMGFPGLHSVKYLKSMAKRAGIIEKGQKKAKKMYKTFCENRSSANFINSLGPIETVKYHGFILKNYKTND